MDIVIKEEWICQRMAVLGVNKEQISGVLHISTSSFVNKIRNKTDFTLPEALMLCKLLKVNINDLYEVNEREVN